MYSRSGTSQTSLTEHLDWADVSYIANTTGDGRPEADHAADHCSHILTEEQFPATQRRAGRAGRRGHARGTAQ